MMESVLMKTYRVTIPYACFVTVELYADDAKAAIHSALDEAYVSAYCGNGRSGQLIGVCSSDSAELSIEAGDVSIDGIHPFKIQCEEITEHAKS